MAKNRIAIPRLKKAPKSEHERVLAKQLKVRDRFLRAVDDNFEMLVGQLMTIVEDQGVAPSIRLRAIEAVLTRVIPEQRELHENKSENAPRTPVLIQINGLEAGRAEPKTITVSAAE